jgi:uncharacterized membrane protein HdeD (DUF308 family)
METSASLNDSIASLKLNRGWLLTLGIALIVLGTVALGDTLTVTVVSVFLIGCLLIASGIFHVVHLVRHSEIRSFWNILGTVCDFGAGLYMIASPTLGALTLTLVLAVFLLVSGVTRLIAVYRANLPHKFWPFLDAILSIGLGILLWMHWPWTGLWFIGFAISIQLIFRGWTWVMVALALGSRIPQSDGSQASALQTPRP